MSRRSLLGVALALLAGTTGGVGRAEEARRVELELVLAVDASGSVSPEEFALQVGGLAAAFRDPAVAVALADAGPDGIAVALLQWSSPGQQVVAVDWTHVRDAGTAAGVADAIERAGRIVDGETAIAPAVRLAAGLLESNAFVGRRRVIDVSGDGASNWGPDPDRARDEAVAAGVTVNALAILNEQPDLDHYYRGHLIGGPDAFLMTARDYRDFAAAILRKLIREIAGAPVALRPPEPALRKLAASATRP